MSLFGKIEGVTEIKSSAEKFHDVLGGRPHHVATITPVKVQECELHDGEFGTVGTTISWKYVHGKPKRDNISLNLPLSTKGKAKVCKQIIEDINDKENSTTYKTIGGDLMEEFKTLTIIVKATTREDGTNFVTWIMDYEKLNADVPDPTSYLEYFDLMTKDIDAHLQEQA